MPSSSEFFGERSAQAVLKHGILTRYSYYFASRAGVATKGNVAFIDGYAGKGRYEDGNPGSPLLLASEAQRATLLGRDVKLAFVEQDDARREQLRQTLSEVGVTADRLVGESFETVALDLIDGYARHAILLFVDPFGLAISFGTLITLLKRSMSRQPIDVLYHFSLSTLARMGSAAVGTSGYATTNARLIDAALGPTPWRVAFENSTVGDGSATVAAITAASDFARQVERLSGVPSVAVEVRQHPEQLPKYLLMLFSRDQKARWDFADLAGKAHSEWLLHCDISDFEAFLRNEGGQESFFPKPPPTLEDVEERLSAKSVPYLTDHLHSVLGERTSIRPINSIEEVYGLMLGRARETHMRSAVKELYKVGFISDNGVGDFFTRDISIVQDEG